MYGTLVKPAFDKILAVMAMILLIVPMLLIALIIRLESRGPSLFRQQRTGKDLKPFYIYKFRTMAHDTPSEMATNDFKDSHMYITKTGKIMRRLGLDELPQLINILKGEMSFIGPRPVILSETKLIAEREKYSANGCVPGITGWAQANGRDTVSIADKARMDGEYAQHFGLHMDASCLVRTIVVLFNSHGYKEGHMEDDSYRLFVSRTTTKKHPSARFLFHLRAMQLRYGALHLKIFGKKSETNYDE